MYNIRKNVELHCTRNKKVEMPCAPKEKSGRVRNMDIRVTNIYVTKRQNPLILVPPEFCGTFRHTNSPFWSNSL